MLVSQFLFYISLSIVLFNLFKLVIREYRKWKVYNEIPGPKGSFVLGNQTELLKNPDKVFEIQKLRTLKYYPIFKSWSLHVRAVNIVSPEDMEIILTSMKHISKTKIYSFLHGWLGTGLLTSTGSKWQSRRKILTPGFHFTILQEFLNIFNNETKNLVDVLLNESVKKVEVDVVPHITQFALLSIGETAFGTSLALDSEDKILYRDAIYKIGHFLYYRAPRPWLHLSFIYRHTSFYKEEKKLIEILHGFSNSVIAERKKTFIDQKSSYATKKRQAMLDLLLTYKSEGADIDDEGIREEVDTFMFEGHDTTSMAICYALMLLANHREIQDEAYQEIHDILGDSSTPPTYTDLQEMSCLERCLKEVLRLYPSVPIIARVAGEDTKTASGYTINKGYNIALHIFGMHHNPNVFPDPEKFDPNRFLPENIKNRHPFAYLPFSAGPRNCIGQKFAMLELKSVICGIIRQFILEPIDRPEDLTFLADMILRPTDKIRVKFVKRKI